MQKRKKAHRSQDQNQRFQKKLTMTWKTTGAKRRKNKTTI